MRGRRMAYPDIRPAAQGERTQDAARMSMVAGRKTRRITLRKDGVLWGKWKA